MADNRVGDVLGQGPTNNSSNPGQPNSSTHGGPDIDLLKSIDKTLKDILANSGMSQSAARSSMPGGRDAANRWQPNRSRQQGRSGRNSFDRSSMNFSSVVDDFTDGLEDALLESIVGSDFKNNVNTIMQNFADAVGIEVNQIPKELGKQLGQNILNSDMGQQLTGQLKGAMGNLGSKLKDSFMSGIDKYQSDHQNAGGGNLRGVFEQIFTVNPNQSQAEAASRQADSAYNSSDTRNTEFDDSVTRFSDAVNRFNDARSAASNTNNSEPQESDLAQQASDMASNSASSTDISSDAVNVATREAGENIAEGAATSAIGSQAAGAASSGTASIGAEAAGAAATSEAGQAGALLASSEGLSAALSGLASVASTALPYILLAVAALVVLDKLFDQFAPAVEGAKKMFESMSKAGNRYQESRKKNLELEKKRLEEDVNAMIEAPFKILEEAAQALYDAWDSNIRTINQTQGYTKDDLYALMGEYSQRLQQEGLTKVISSADIISNLEKVLESGLSGDAAVEFAYLATKLSSAIPTQDFFNYADTYASIAANAQVAGASQSEAIASANEQLEAFASNLLYSSRELSGGFSSGLSNASELFAESVKIAQTAKTNNSNQISGVLTSVSAIVGAVAPDLANELVSAIVSAATGGNSQSIVALRSLAGINASNTEFLEAFAKDPQAVFEEVFKNFGNMQNMAPDAYMEVAEGLADIFGVSMDAIARVDFNYLAQAISEMNTNNRSLDENLQLLKSGESTATAEQLKMQQINEYMLEEGLAYVMDNEVARSIQEHMWDEQLAREMQEASYAVELQGGALDFLEGIKQTIDNIMNFLNPFGALKKLVNLVATAQEANAQQADIKQLLELGKVGNGNAQDLYNLTTRNQDLNLASNIVDLMGGSSAYASVSNGLQAFNQLTNVSGWMDGRSALKSAISATLQNALTSSSSSKVSSKYSWAMIGKSTATAFQNSQMADTLGAVQLSSRGATQANINSSQKQNFQGFLDSMKTYIGDKQAADQEYSYDDWKTSMAAKYKISDIDAELEKYGLSEGDLQGQFSAQETAYAAEYEAARRKNEDAFWAEGTKYFLGDQDKWITWQTLVTTNQQTMIENQSLMIENQQKMVTYLEEKQIASLLGIQENTKFMYDKFGSFYRDWTDYYIDHTFYTENSNSAWSKVKAEEKDAANDSVLSLAKALTEQTESFKDPTVQTNALLAKILIVVEAIMQQNNESNELTLPDALSALATGLVIKT